ncbi:hypothetical protein HH800_00855 [Sphingobium yanoikuyae]|uniref:EpsG family protein n=1 Tax=Sphingobium yanoikuyae TaxID=13690 RepID=A0A6M4G1C1_SPHYA|nr:EpsG family protein [Sphingobium yanoikuyae]QJR00869.1 hypothetical protein HH800_00855 [Sphingobium yanoikuyae]
MSRVAKIGALLAALCFALILWAIDWEAVKGAPFSDLQNYLEGFYYGRYRYDQAGSLVEWFTQEYLWRGLVYELGFYFDFTGIFSAIALIVLTISCVFVAHKTRSPIYLLLLVSPLTIELAFSQSRSAFGMALIWLALMSDRKVIKYALLILAPLIHTAMLIYAVALLIPWDSGFIRKRAGIIAALLIIGSAIALGTLRDDFLDNVGDRRAYLEIVRSGVLFTAMLASYGLPFAFYPRLILQDRAALLAVLSATISLAANLSGGAGNRFVALALPAIIVGISRLPNTAVRRTAFVYVLASSMAYLVLFWVG